MWNSVRCDLKDPPRLHQRMHRLVVSLKQIKEQSMRTTVTIDDTLLAQAQALSGIRENGPLLKTALQALIQRESALRLARLGGSQPDLKDVPRRRSAEN